MWRIVKQMVPDYSGKYYGKINDKWAVKLLRKVSKNATAGKKAYQRNYQNSKRKHNGKDKD